MTGIEPARIAPMDSKVNGHMPFAKSTYILRLFAFFLYQNPEMQSRFRLLLYAFKEMMSFDHKPFANFPIKYPN